MSNNDIKLIERQQIIDKYYNIIETNRNTPGQIGGENSTRERKKTTHGWQ